MTTYISTLKSIFIPIENCVFEVTTSMPLVQYRTVCYLFGLNCVTFEILCVTIAYRNYFYARCLLFYFLPIYRQIIIFFTWFNWNEGFWVSIF